MKNRMNVVEFDGNIKNKTKKINKSTKYYCCRLALPPKRDRRFSPEKRNTEIIIE